VVSEPETQHPGERKFRIMPPRRCKDIPIENTTMEGEMRKLCARLDAMETT
jgi:hypothetical protein